jgi:hypothetical protein
VIQGRKAARTLLAAAVLGLLSQPCRAQDEEPDPARKHFEQGVLLFQDEDYEGALVSFLASFDANPNYKVRYNIGLCLQALHRYTEAERHLKAYLAEGAGSIPTERIAEVNDILIELGNVIGEIEVSSEVEGATVYLDDQMVGKTPLGSSLRVDIGLHEIRVEKEGHESFETEVTTPGNTSVKVWVDLPVVEVEEPVVVEPVKEKPRKSKPVPKGVVYAHVGLTAALAAGAAVTGALVLKKKSDFLDTYREDTEKWTKIRSDGRKLALVTDILIGTAGGVALVTVLLAAFTDWKGEKRSIGLLPAVGPETAGLELEWRF